MATTKSHVRAVSLRNVKRRFSKPIKDVPWNLLELSHHWDDGLRPAFLVSEAICSQTPSC
ncbi:hypothetical protein BAUCODRAFT_32732 [Baudoinia panamericana UAMH 10762]|uniref:Uncharacterized protein n=1 Tax=Baudoinia panamericana (strain UAMH 10762) TaxID=717646 RepID=M2MZG3_BAUPA|nr:uncharacterized protein BAUCODRAFT_32732 [Baudoinia panamericana UAMH 10762]EMC96988.1 hypothetical protein BAUCODRAFT_32732 [Baudoinia panamericana UAMH 10762]